ncbi:MAG: hypothetical protein M1838_002055 [Thelocarpon superellum]|nr:MAG: hypothetical protein M1838_002055 [Thelocarpon superellum]
MSMAAMVGPSSSQGQEAETFVEYTNPDGEVEYFDASRRPALYTQDFGDCLGSSVVNVTRFDAAFYQDNMTVLFHLGGTTNVHNESTMLHISVFAYGASQFDLTFNPCDASVTSMCPMKAGVPIEANGIIPVAPSDVAGIPPIALSIPDFEGQAIVRIFANSTESEIGCYSAVVTNGASFSQPGTVGSIIGLFTVIAVLASFATAIYGDHVPTMRKHHAHSISVFVVFAVLQHIFFTGAMSLDWPSVLSAFWSNYAWAGGMIYVESMQNTINTFLASNLGNTTSVGAAGSGPSSNNVGGPVPIQSIYRRAARDWLLPRTPDVALVPRDLINASTGYPWYGRPSKPGMPLPGNFSGFAGTLSAESIPASNAFMTGLLWLLILILIVGGGIAAFKWALEALSAVRWIRRDRLSFFRTHWLGFTTLAVLRTLFIAFFMMILLTLFQSSYKGTVAVTALAAIVFVLFLGGTLVIAGYACFYRLRHGHYLSAPDRLHFQRTMVWKVVPWVGSFRESQGGEKGSDRVSLGSIPWRHVRYVDHDPQRVTVHEDEAFIRKFGWLAARYRRTRWWFFAVWLIYEFVRACFYGGAAAHPMTQVFGLLVVEIIAFIAIIKLKPFEGTRLNVIMVYLLGFSKVFTTGLSATFVTQFSVPRITATVIGVVIIVTQGILTVALMVCIIMGAVSSYLSLTRNHETFSPQSWAPLRAWFFKHIDQAAGDQPSSPPPPPVLPLEPTDPNFRVSSVRRCPKIEDEDGDFLAEISDPFASRLSVNQTFTRASRRSSLGANSVSTFTTVPFGARVHRASWSMKDFEGAGMGVGEGGHSRSSTAAHIHPPHSAWTMADGFGPSDSTHSLARGSTPGRTSTPVRSSTPVRTSTPVRGVTPVVDDLSSPIPEETMTPLAEEAANPLDDPRMVPLPIDSPPMDGVEWPLQSPSSPPPHHA